MYHSAAEDHSVVEVGSPGPQALVTTRRLTVHTGIKSYTVMGGEVSQFVKLWVHFNGHLLLCGFNLYSKGAITHNRLHRCQDNLGNYARVKITSQEPKTRQPHYWDSSECFHFFSWAKLCANHHSSHKKTITCKTIASQPRSPPHLISCWYQLSITIQIVMLPVFLSGSVTSLHSFNRAVKRKDKYA